MNAFDTKIYHWFIGVWSSSPINFSSNLLSIAEASLIKSTGIIISPELFHALLQGISWQNVKFHTFTHLGSDDIFNR